MNYLVIDLEMCKVPKQYRSRKYRYSNEIIQVGAVLLDEAYEEVGRINQYVHPEYGVLDQFIADLTGIKNCNIKNAPLLESVLTHMVDWLGEREYKIYAWSGNDRSQLLHEIKGKKIENEKIDYFMRKENWIDYQDVYGKRFGFSREVALEEALLACDIDVQGTLHNGLDDAINTASIIKLLEKNENIVLKEVECLKKLDKESSGFCLGELFEGLNLACLA